MSSMSDVDIEKGKVEVEVFSKTEAALSQLRKKYKKYPSLDTEEGYEFVKTGIKELVTLRTKLEAERKRIKDPYLKAGKIIDSEAQRITAELVKLENPMKDEKKKFDDREKRLKEERLARLSKKIDDIRNKVDLARGKSSNEIAELIQDVDNIDTSEDFFELSMDAEKARQSTLDKLSEMYTEKLSFERAEEERKKAEEEARKLRRKSEISEKINKISMIPVDMMGKSSEEIVKKIESLENYPPVQSEFDDQYDVALLAYQKTIVTLNELWKQTSDSEKLRIQENNKKVEEHVSRNMLDKPKVVGVDMANEPDKTVTNNVEPINRGITDEEKQALFDPKEVDEFVENSSKEVAVLIRCNQANYSDVLNLLIDQLAVEVSGDEEIGFIVSF